MKTQNSPALLSSSAELEMLVKKQCCTLHEILLALLRQKRNSNNFQTYTYIRLVMSVATLMQNKEYNGSQNGVSLCYTKIKLTQI